MIETKYICDRCAVIVDDNYPFYILQKQIVQRNLPATFPMRYTDGVAIHDPYNKACHLCEDCVNELFDWVEKYEETN